MRERTVQLVLHYDGAGFAGWQRQPDVRTVQAVVEEALAQLCGGPVAVLGAGRTDAGVHATGQSAGARIPEKWERSSLRRALNATLPSDVWVESVFLMRPDFHARYGATSRRYAYRVGTDADARSPFRRRWEWSVERELSHQLLQESARALLGDHCFRAFAVRGTAPEGDHHRCTVLQAAWRDRPGGVTFEIEANRFLHHMVRFLVGTMVDVASGRRDPGTIPRLLGASDNLDTSPPAPAHGLFLEHVDYPRELYLDGSAGDREADEAIPLPAGA
ncbi:MAG TPA: tRNA pseudouridine(38-40) synthase TruA [Gemmatimonadaceae bacterium]|nr:tRNA pseudouridine(38-40) synthase TruA [Gemmatimonadaceae bacterium]